MTPLVALAGVPNCGKTALFNALTGSRQKVANYPGVTVERKEGIARSLPSGAGGSAPGAAPIEVRILDLPGTYSLQPQSPDEAITRDVLMQKLAGGDRPGAVIAVADTLNLERNLSFVLELRSLGIPMVLALNMMDLAEARGMKLDLDALSRELGMPVVPTVAIRGQGTRELLERVHGCLETQAVRSFPALSPPLSVDARFKEVDRILSIAVKTPARPASVSDRIDAFVLHPVTGVLTLLVVLTIVFQAVFSWAAPFQDLIRAGIAWVGTFVGGFLADGLVKSLLVDGILAGVGGVLVFLPQILFLFFFILILEDSGYMARAAFLMDRLMSKVGLHGRAFLPLLSSFACAIPGIMAARIIASSRDRLATILILSLMTCSAWIFVYTFLIS
jgi:ferrous iron transport protein B